MLHLSTLSHSCLSPLEKIQNKAMRIILGAPISTRISVMHCELNLPPRAEHIKQAEQGEVDAP